MFLTCQICHETRLELIRNDVCNPPPPYASKVFKPCLFGVKWVVYMKQGPRSGIFSVYILRNVDYILLTYSCPWFCVQFFFLIVKRKSCDLLILVMFHSKLCEKAMCLYVCVRAHVLVRRRSHTLTRQLLDRPNAIQLWSHVLELTLILQVFVFLCCSPASCLIGSCCQ